MCLADYLLVCVIATAYLIICSMDYHLRAGAIIVLISMMMMIRMMRVVMMMLTMASFGIFWGALELKCFVLQ